METIIAILIFIMATRKPVVISWGKNYRSITICSSNIWLKPLFQGTGNKPIDRFDCVDIVHNGKLEEDEPRRYKSQVVCVWLIFEVYYVKTFNTFVGDIYPKGYDYKQDTPEGIKAKSDELNRRD